VAVSRCRTVEGLRVIRYDPTRVIADPTVMRFAAKHCNDPIAQQLLRKQGIDLETLPSAIGTQDPAAEEERQQAEEELGLLGAGKAVRDSTDSRHSRRTQPYTPRS